VRRGQGSTPPAQAIGARSRKGAHERQKVSAGHPGRGQEGHSARRNARRPAKHLREPAEACAAQLIKGADRSAVADEVEGALQYLDIDELNTRADHRPGFGYVDPAEAADEILDEALQPFLDDLQRRAGLGMRSAAAELAANLVT
jgi:hypothetical protein